MSPLTTSCAEEHVAAGGLHEAGSGCTGSQAAAGTSSAEVDCSTTQLDTRSARADRAKSEDPDTRVARLYEAEIGRLTRFGRKVTGDSSAAEDLAQEVFVDLLQQLRADPDYLQGPAWFWLKEAMIHHAANRQRQLTRESEHLGRLHASLGDEFEPGETHLDFDRALAQLPPRMRQCVVMACVQDMTQEEIASALGCTVRTVETHLHRARPRLAELMGVEWTPRAMRTSKEGQA
jgi:RNA polymerase sigma-70 factor (ECF subfamily)